MNFSPLIEAAWNGRIAHLSGLDVIGSTAGALSRIIQDREIELWEHRRIVSEASEEEVHIRFQICFRVNSHPLQIQAGQLSVAHKSFRIISTASKSLPLKDWLSDEHCNMFFPIPSQPMSDDEEEHILLSTGSSPALVKLVLTFARKYRETISVDNVQKNRKLGTRTLVRIMKRLTVYPDDSDLHAIICRSLLADFLPTTERMSLESLLDEADIRKSADKVNYAAVSVSEPVIHRDSYRFIQTPWYEIEYCIFHRRVPVAKKRCQSRCLCSKTLKTPKAFCR